MTDAAGAGERKTNVFISYSRQDSVAADRLHAALSARGFNPYLDRHDIAAGEDWKVRLGGLIDAADTMVFLISPDSIASEVCDWEINHAELRGKRILPVLARDAENVPERLQRLNYVFMRSPEEEATNLLRLADALSVDIAWIRSHTRYGDDANDWDRAGRPGRLVLRGASIAEAERWRDTRPPTAPQLTDVQSAFVAASRRAATSRQRRWITGSLAIAVMAIGLTVYAFVQQQAAEAGRLEVTVALATSDFRRGNELLGSPGTSPDGVAYLARAARAGDARAQTRLWTLLQQRRFWIPSGTAPATPLPPATPVAPEIAERFALVEFNGKMEEASQIGVSPNGGRVVVTLRCIAACRFRVFEPDGTPVTDWLLPPDRGGDFPDFLRGYFSDQGRYLAVESGSHFGTGHLNVYDLDANGGPQVLKSADMHAGGSLQSSRSGFGVVKLVRRAGESDAYGPPTILTGSYRGDAAQFEHLGELGYTEVRRIRQRSPMAKVEVDPTLEWLMAATEDRTVTVLGAGGEPLGSSIRSTEPVTSLARGADDRLDIGQGSFVASFTYKPANPTAYRGNMTYAPHSDSCFDASDGTPVAHGSGLVIGVKDGRQVELGRTQGLVTARSPRFEKAITLVCATDSGDRVAISFEDFRTEVWFADFSQRVGQDLDMSRLFDEDAMPGTVRTLLSPDGRHVLIRSSYDPQPAETRDWYAVWDIESGLPVADLVSFDRGSDAAFDPETGQVVYFDMQYYRGDPALTAISLDPPPAAVKALPDYLEGIGGQMINSGGILVGVPNRSERLQAGYAMVQAMQNQ